MDVLRKKRIVLGVTGSIAAYKAAAFASSLKQHGANVDVILTKNAERFITPLTFQTLTGRKAFTDADLWGEFGHEIPIEVGHDADLIIIAPCTSNTIAKLNHGISDNLLTLVCTTASCPILIAPAMDIAMYDNKVLQSNLRELVNRGVKTLGPLDGQLSYGVSAVGRMMETTEILNFTRYFLSRDKKLKGKKFIVTVGGTKEYIDPIRFITNRSTGQQGYEIAQAAMDMGADVILITTIEARKVPYGAEVIHVNTAEEMKQAVLNRVNEADVLIMAADVSDFRPKNIHKHKIKKGKDLPNIELEFTDDILSAVSELKSKSDYPLVTVGFAAESRNMLDNANQKLNSKRLDMIVANNILTEDEAYDPDFNRVTILYAGGEVEPFDLMGKYDISVVILERIIQRL
ncbi:MAG: bifunctional phosphopantothenoylcysteine decarboxylase/phosphopantothenate--cysteine ligase CoaBC [Anaerolineaceae bacterium]|nr:bifunctional phosphopantothenoylcysteine decarboxylase/phosphopantothenate--cysteine ligase CoaBC [Anaerolineaceae bacterium]